MSSWLIGVTVFLVAAAAAVVISAAFFGWFFWREWIHTREGRQR